MSPSNPVFLLLSSLCLLACASAPSAPTAPPSTSGSSAPASTATPDAAASIAAICSTKHVDQTSQIFPARDAAGKITRYSVTPSRRIADMGNLIFDARGGFLGHDIGGEPPGDPKLMEQERVRVAALLGGAQVAGGEKPLRCP